MHNLQDHLLQVNKGINWQLVLIGIGMIAGSVTWSVRKVFTTHNDMENCKSAIMRNLNEHEVREGHMVEEYMKRNDDAHNELWKDIKWIKAFLIEHGSPHD